MQHNVFMEVVHEVFVRNIIKIIILIVQTNSFFYVFIPFQRALRIGLALAEWGSSQKGPTGLWLVVYTWSSGDLSIDELKDAI